MSFPTQQSCCKRNAKIGTAGIEGGHFFDEIGSGRVKGKENDRSGERGGRMVFYYIYLSSISSSFEPPLILSRASARFSLILMYSQNSQNVSLGNCTQDTTVKISEEVGRDSAKEKQREREGEGVKE